MPRIPKSQQASQAPSVSNSTEEKTSPKKERVKKPVKPVEREVIYSKIGVSLCDGDKAITASDAKKILGWAEESENVKFGSDYQLIDSEGKKVRCFNNTTNRPIQSAIVQTLKQEILRKKWRLNGETIILGETGLVLDGQHTLIALVLASQDWFKHKGQYLEREDGWKEEPKIQKIIVKGIAEDDTTVNTINTARPRTLSDCIFRSALFAKYGAKDRRLMSKIAENCVKMLWHRTGARMNAFAPIRTHAESLDFVARHERILQAVIHIYEENGTDQRIGRYLSPGYASSLLYLQGCCLTEREKDDATGYSQVPNPSEGLLDFSEWDRAQNFWTLLAAGSEELLGVRSAIGTLLENNRGNVAERYATLVKAWNRWASGDSTTEEDLALEYATDKDGITTLAECPIVGGIDIGNG